MAGLFPKARNERIETGHKGRNVSVEKKNGRNVISGKQQDNDQEEQCQPIVDNKHTRLFLLQKRIHRLTEESLRKALGPGEKGFLERAESVQTFPPMKAYGTAV